MPIACSLDDDALRARRDGLLAAVRGRALDARALEDGVLLGFEPQDGLLAELASLIDAERRCCPFLRFTLTVEPAGGRVSLRVAAPAQALGFVLDLFDTVPPRTPVS